MHARFYAPEAQVAGAVIALPQEEVAHLTRVLRLGVGADVRVFNGAGGEFEATVTDVARTRVLVRLLRAHPPAPEARVSVTLAQAVLKGDKMDGVVRDAVMLGVAAIQPVVAARSEVTLATLDRARRGERWHRIAVSAAKQCGRAVVPAIHAPLACEALVAALARGALPQPAILLTEPRLGERSARLSDLGSTAPAAATLMVGPEGGWTAEELSNLSTVCAPLTLGQRILRADAAPVIAIAALYAAWKEF